MYDKSKSTFRKSGISKIENAFSNYISGALENKLNENFHSGLTTLEQSGILYAEKILEHEKRVKKQKQLLLV